MQTLPDERQQSILSRLASGARVVAAELAREFGTSEDTIRRDLREIAAAGLCRRVYGGALPLSPAGIPYREREAEAPERKAAIGRRAASLVRGGQVVLIDAGSTNLAVARALPAGLGLTVVTNAPAIASVLTGRDGIELLLIGGRVDPRSGATGGAAAIEQMRGTRADLCFLGACSVDVEAGIGAFDAEEAAFKRAMMRASRAVAIAATTEKLGTQAPYHVAPLSEMDHLVLEADAPASLRSALLGACRHA